MTQPGNNHHHQTRRYHNSENRGNSFKTTTTKTSFGPFVFPFFKPAYSVTVAKDIPQNDTISTGKVSNHGDDKLPLPVQDAIACLLHEKFKKSAGVLERLNPSLQVLDETHVFRQLLRPTMLERYEIYKHKENADKFISSLVTPTTDSHTHINSRSDPQQHTSNTTTTSSTQCVDDNSDGSKDDDHDASTIVTGLLTFGTLLDGHPGIVHGGVLALILDETIGFAYEALGIWGAFTAHLSVNYKAPVPAGSSGLVHVQLKKEATTERKLYFEAVITSLDGTMVYTEASCLYIVPRQRLASKL